MNEPETRPPSEPPVEQTAAASEASTPKPPRNPVERAVVWGLILLGLAFAGYEARAKFGYDSTYNSISKQLQAIDESSDPGARFTYDQAMSLASLSPTISDELPMVGLRKARRLTWPSLAKTYELTLIMDEDNVVLGIETPDPPAEPEPEYPSTDEDGESPAGGGAMAGGGGGPPPSHEAQGGGLPATEDGDSEKPESEPESEPDAAKPDDADGDAPADSPPE
jgi:hypothetical protein